MRSTTSGAQYLVIEREIIHSEIRNCSAVQSVVHHHVFPTGFANTNMRKIRLQSYYVYLQLGMIFTTVGLIHSCVEAKLSCTPRYIFKRTRCIL